jgi:arachidonate 15-lipoxygenase
MEERAVLPQDDADLPGRAAELAAARDKYKISFNIVPGVPMAAAVPDEATPNAIWTATVLVPLTKIIANVVANRVEQVEGTIDTAFERAIGRSVSFGGLIEGVTAAARALGDVLRELEPAASHKVVNRVLMGQHITHHDDATAPDPWQSPLTPHGRPASRQAYDDLYREIDTPPVMASWHEDAWFARMRVAGHNPMLIRGITELPARFPVTEAHFAATARGGDTLAAALSEGRLFLLDYQLIGEMVHDNLSPVVGDRKYTPAPIALFGVPPDGGTLQPIAIQAGQDPAAFGIVTPKDGWAWRKAKTAVQVADANHHELICHLGRTHLIMEAAALATVRNLSPRHPLHKLLMPHFEGTVAINNSAAHSMLAPGGVIDLSFGGTLDSMIALAQRAVRDYDFHAALPPVEFERRGVGPASRLTDYPFRDDALLIWGAIRDWAQAYVDHYYDDAALAADTELAAWSDALSAPVAQGGIGGFTPVRDTAALVTALAMIMFTASAQHAAVNFTQWADMSYSPALAGALWAEWKEGDATEQDWLDLLPPLQFGELQAEFLALLGGVHHTHLGEYKSNLFPYPDTITDPAVVAGPLAAFRKRLHQIEVAIGHANRDLTTRSAPYEYLMPSRIPASINI